MIKGKGVTASVIQSVHPSQDLKLTSLRIISPLPAHSRGVLKIVSKRSRIDMDRNGRIVLHLDILGAPGRLHQLLLPHPMRFSALES